MIMKHEQLQKAKIDATTGEIYVSYPRVRKPDRGRVRQFTRWFSQKIDNHFDRLIELRVYDDKRYDYSRKK